MLPKHNVSNTQMLTMVTIVVAADAGGVYVRRDSEDVLGISGRRITKGAFRRVLHIDILYSPNDVGGDARNLE